MSDFSRPQSSSATLNASTASDTGVEPGSFPWRDAPTPMIAVLLCKLILSAP